MATLLHSRRIGELQRELAALEIPCLCLRPSLARQREQAILGELFELERASRPQPHQETANPTTL